MPSNSRRVRALARYLAASLGAAATVIAVSLGGVTAANAAEGTPTAVDSVTFENTTFQDQSTQTLDVSWHATESPATNPVVVSFELPDGLHGVGATFAIDNGTCTITSTTATCTIDPDYVTANPDNIHGSFTMGVQVDLKNHDTATDQIWNIGGVETNPVTVTSRFCSTNCQWNGTGASKYGSYNNSNDTITWTVQVPSHGDGFTTAGDGKSLEPGQTITVTDPFTGNPFTIQDGSPWVSVAGCMTTDSWGYQSAHYTTLDATETTISADKTSVAFTTAAGGCSGVTGTDPTPLVGSVYQVHWTVKAEDGGKGVVGPGTYSNTATISVNGTDTSVTGTATRYTYGGTAVGDNFGRFELKKAFDTTDTLQPQSVTVDYVINYPGDVPPATSGSFTLGADNNWSYLSDQIFKGSTVTLTEENPGPANVDWSTALTDGNGNPVQGTTGPNSTSYTITVAGNAIGNYTLTNTGTVPEQAQNAKKVLDNPDGVTLPQGTSFELDATWPDNADLGIKGGSQSVELPADGTTVAFPQLPVGANVTFTEKAPTDIPGATWTGSTVSPGTLTIGPDTKTVTVTATNTLKRNVGTFSIEKDLTGDAAGLVTDPTFDVDYSYPADPSLGIEAGSGVAKVTAGGTPTTVTAPAGAAVTLSENPVKVTGGTWAQPVFTPGATFTVAQDENVSVGLTNLITLDTGAFSLHKTVNGTGASSLPKNTTFTVHYSYPAGTGFLAGSGDLTVKAGTTVTSPQLPYGAVVTLKEDAPATVTGATWSKPVFSPSTVTIGDGTTANVTLTNTLTTIPAPSLAHTGSDVSTAVIPAAALLVAGLAMLLLMRRRRA